MSYSATAEISAPAKEPILDDCTASAMLEDACANLTETCLRVVERKVSGPMPAVAASGVHFQQVSIGRSPVGEKAWTASLNIKGVTYEIACRERSSRHVVVESVEAVGMQCEEAEAANLGLLTVMIKPQQLKVECYREGYAPLDLSWVMYCRLAQQVAEGAASLG